MSSSRARTQLLQLGLALAALACALAVPAATAASADGTPDPVAAAAIAYANQNYRQPLGLPNLSWDDRLARAATAHVQYWLLNDGTGHSEEPGKPGFTGASPSDRCWFAGAAPYGEVAYPGKDLSRAVPGWLATPYHGLPFLSSQIFGCAEGKAGSACNMSGTSDPLHGQELDYSAAVNTALSPVRIWPYEGASSIETGWGSAEIPDPLENYTGDRHSVGPIMFVGAAEAARVSLYDANGTRLLLLAPAAATASASLTVDRNPYTGGLGWTAFFAAHELTANGTYTLTVSDPAGRSWSTRFRAIANDPNLSVSLDASRGSLSVGAKSTATTAVVTISNSGGTTLARANVKINHSWAWPGFLRGGRFVVCAELPSNGTYSAARECDTKTLHASTRGLLSVGRLTSLGTTASLTLRARGVLLGRRATITLTQTFRSGCGTLCGGWPRSRKQRLKVTLRPTQSFRVPFESRSGWGARITVNVPVFTLAGVRYQASFVENPFYH